MSANPILAQSTRGNWVENIHRGAFCIGDADGKIIAAKGDISRHIFPRSAIKAMQALALYKSGAVERYSLEKKDVALACASHHGTQEHVAIVKQFLSKIGCDISDLECGAHNPVGANARKSLFLTGEKASAIHNNCSGKHAGMLAVAKAIGAPSKDYSTREHAAQKLVRACVEEIVGVDFSEVRCGTDGCSIPTWAAPLSSFAFGFAKMASGKNLSEETALASRLIFDAVISNPDLIRGKNSLDSDLMRAFEGRLMIKVGADGVFCGALLDQKFGFSLKIDDGNMDAAEVATAHLLLEYSDTNESERAVLEKYRAKILKNWRKLEVATIEAVTLTGA